MISNFDEPRAPSTPRGRRRALCWAARISFVCVGLGAPAWGQGLQGEYYNVPDPPAVGTPGDFGRLDGSLAFTWAGDAPDGTPILADDAYSERWTGFVRIDAAGDWTFTVNSNDGARLWVDGVQYIDEWNNHPAQDDVAVVTFAQTGWFPIRVEHYNEGGIATAYLSFAGPGQPQVVIPPGFLSPVDPVGLPDVDAGEPAHVVPPAVNVQLQGSATDPDGIASVQWTQLQGPTAAIAGANTLQPTITPSASGLHLFQLRATDTLGASATDQVSLFAITAASGGGVVSGTQRKWFKTTVTFDHDTPQSEGSADNPFLNYRLQVLFFHLESETMYEVPGFYAADGDAANTGANAGVSWRAHFTPDQSGTWFYLASFRRGFDIAVDLDPLAGSPVSFDGTSGSFDVKISSPLASGFLRKGRLEYVNAHHLRFAETHEYRLKGGADSPENMLGYYEFDGTFDAGGFGNGLNSGGHGDGLHHFDAHFADYMGLGQLWMGGKGQRLLGGLNYLSSKGVNSSYFLTYNIDGGDGGEVWPWVSTNDKTRMDASKLAQWGIVFDHMTARGIALHVITQETENDQGINGGSLGRERKLYYRELVARFGHSLALSWNLGEENTNTDTQRRDFANYIRAQDPYDHPITVHTYGNQIDLVFGPLLGFENFNGPSLQTLPPDIHWWTKNMIDQSAGNGHPWIVHYDEQGSAQDGVVPDSVDFWHDGIRRDALWGNLMAGGGGVEYYFGYSHPHDDVDCEDWRSRDHMWDLTAYAVDFFQDYLPFWEMRHADELTSDGNDYVFAKDGEIYAVYRPFGGNTSLDLATSTDTFKVEWYDPRNGGPLTFGSVAQITGPGFVNIGNPPGGSDWVALVRPLANRKPVITSTAVTPEVFSGNDDLAVQIHAFDPDGLADVNRVEVHFWRPTGVYLGGFNAPRTGGDLYTAFFPNLGSPMVGTWTYLALAVDQAGEYEIAVGDVQVQ